jgi:4-hydroxyphenylpyruvate dioxygenase
MVGNVGWGEMNRWVEFYSAVMGFRMFKHFDDKDISTEYSALMSKVMSNGNERVKFPINEPAEGKRKSQIEEYLQFYRGPGVQHIAMATDNIIETVGALAAAGRGFSARAILTMTTYSRASAPSTRTSPSLRKLGILVDRDDEGYMLQIFTRPVEDRPTLFYEVIQRKGSRSFGKGNFKALFEAIEREQERRGNLYRVTLLLTAAQRLNRRPAERRQIFRLAAGDKILVYHHFGVHPVRAGVHHVVFDREETGCLAAFEHAAGGTQNPRAVADCGH